MPEVNEPVLTLRELRSLVPGASAADEALEAAEREPAVEARRALLAQAESALRQEHLVAGRSAARSVRLSHRGGGSDPNEKR